MHLAHIWQHGITSFLYEDASLAILKVSEIFSTFE
jgi:hypothetical protein